MKAMWCALFIILDVAHAAADVPTELEDCITDADFCFSFDPVLIDEACGARFESFQGSISWPPLKNVGPVTIAVQTRHVGRTNFPFYVEIAQRGHPGDPGTCRPWTGEVVLVAQGGTQCGGTWESIGPIDLAAGFGVPLGSNYSVHCLFFRSLPTEPPGREARSVGFSCIRVTSTPTPLAPGSWSLVKRLYRDATR
jgi:hypothetical protein